MPRYSIQQQVSMAGKKAQAKAKVVAPKSEPKPKPAMEPRVKNRIDALTKPAHETKEHHGLLRAVSNVLQRGVNDMQGDTSLGVNRKGTPALPSNLTDLYSRLHNASLHLDAHHRADSKGHHDIAAAHLHKATDQLTRVANHLANNGMSSVRDADGSEFPMKFVGTLARDVNNHYRTEKAGIESPTGLKNVDVKDTHKQLLNLDTPGGSPIKSARVVSKPSSPTLGIPGRF